MKIEAFPYHDEPKMSETTKSVLGMLSFVAIIAVALLLAGCASWTDYAAEVREVNTKIAADKKAEREAEQKGDGAFFTTLASPNLSKEERIAMMGFWAMTKAKGGSSKDGPGYMALSAPPDPLDSAVKVLGIVAPVAGNVGMAAIQAGVAKAQSMNALETARSTNASMVALGAESGATARAVVAQIPALRPSMTFTIGRDGTIGDGMFAPVTSTLTAGGDGVQNGGAITRPANPTRLCTVTSTGSVNCGP